MIVSRLLSPLLRLKIITNIAKIRQLTMAKQVQDDSKFTGVRLPTNVKPVHYDLYLKPNFEDFTFSGKVSIAYKSNSVADLTNSVVLHAEELEITDGSVKSSDGASGENRLNTVTYSKTSETATLEFNDTIASDGVINLVFTGCLNDKMKGFYRTSFDIGKTKVYAATTQFESTDARLAFPCWDEPALKATFTVTLVIDKYMNVEGKQYERVALSNMPEVSRSGPDNEVEVKFEKSPIMSTYLLAFIIGPFEALEGSDTRRPVRVFTTPGKTSHGQFALDVACKSLPYYEDYFGVKYPLPKMDLIAIPDFTSGAMENWGLVTYRETCLLVDPNNTATAVKQYVAIVVAHELAHQWFGNLVTMEWWTHLWLNEGFATFMEYLCTDYIFPEWSIFSQFLSDSYNSALNTDALDNSHPIEIPVNNPSEINEIFDNISYQKGASVIRMLYTYIGDDDFRKGMKDYLTKFAYKNATTEDLWDCLEAASCKPIRKLMSGWTSQKGFPWLAVEYSQDGDKAKLTLTQNKFSANGQVPAGDAHSMWMVPINAITGSQPNKQVQLCLLDAKSKEVTIDGLGNDWVKLNPGMIGLYRVAYPEELAKRLHSAVLNQSLPPMDRLGLQSDAHALCKAGMLGSVELLQLLQSYKEETELAVWRSIDDCLGRFSVLISDSDFKDSYYAFGRQLLTEIFKRLTWVPQGGESDQTAMTRGLVLNRLVAFKEESVLEEAKRLYTQHVAGISSIPADLRNAVYRAVSVFGDDEAFDNLFNIWKTTELSEEKNRVARALGFTKNENRLKRVVELVLSDAVRNQDKVYFLLSIGASSPAVAWTLFKDNREQLKEKFGSGHLMSRIVEIATTNFTTEEMAKEIEDYFSTNKLPGTERTVQQSVENVRLNASWLARDGKTMKEYLQKFQ